MASTGSSLENERNRKKRDQEKKLTILAAIQSVTWFFSILTSIAFYTVTSVLPSDFCGMELLITFMEAISAFCDAIQVAGIFAASKKIRQLAFSTSKSINSNLVNGNTPLNNNR